METSSESTRGVRALNDDMDRILAGAGAVRSQTKSALEKCKGYAPPSAAIGPRPEYLLHLKKTGKL